MHTTASPRRISHWEHQDILLDSMERHVLAYWWPSFASESRTLLRVLQEDDLPHIHGFHRFPSALRLCSEIEWCRIVLVLVPHGRSPSERIATVVTMSVSGALGGRGCHAARAPWWLARLGMLPARCRWSSVGTHDHDVARALAVYAAPALTVDDVALR